MLPNGMKIVLYAVMNRILLIFIFMITLSPVMSQEEEKPDRIVVYATMIDGDTIPVVYLSEHKVFSFKPYKSRREEKRMT